LGFAYRECKNEQDIIESNLIFVGMTGMIDPPREEVYDALVKCKKAGMKAIMITGDHKDTAYAIAKELGMVKSEKEVVNGSHLDSFTDEELVKEIRKFKVFTRVSPEHKVRIVKALQANGKVVAMTGDGVNDAPSIKSANIGIGMGNVGTEVTKDVADMILTDDNFATIVLAVEEGRKIFGNIQKTIQFLLGTNIAEVLSIFAITLLFPQYTLFTAVQILFTNLVTDTFPSIALGCNEAENDLMKQPPRDPKQYIIGGRVGFNIIYQGFTQAFIVVCVYLIGLFGFGSPAIATTMAFLSINMVQLFHMFSVRTVHSIFASNPFKNKLLNIAFVSEVAIILLVALIPPVAGVLNLTQLSLVQWLIVFGCSMLILPVVEIVKFGQKKKDQRKALEQPVDSTDEF
jgi:Ca2+-transporting ATPase